MVAPHTPEAPSSSQSNHSSFYRTSLKKTNSITSLLWAHEQGKPQPPFSCLSDRPADEVGHRESNTNWVSSDFHFFPHACKNYLFSACYLWRLYCGHWLVHSHKINLELPKSCQQLTGSVPDVALIDGITNGVFRLCHISVDVSPSLCYKICNKELIVFMMPVATLTWPASSLVTDWVTHKCYFRSQVSL